jgi:hypothetical protein
MMMLPTTQTQKDGHQLLMIIGGLLHSIGKILVIFNQRKVMAKKR